MYLETSVGNDFGLIYSLDLIFFSYSSIVPSEIKKIGAIDIFNDNIYPFQCKENSKVNSLYSLVDLQGSTGSIFGTYISVSSPLTFTSSNVIATNQSSISPSSAN